MSHRAAGRRGIMGMLAAFAVTTACGQSSDDDLARLALRVDSLAVTLTQVTQQLNGRKGTVAPETLTVGAVGAAVRGDPRAPVTIVEFTDYQCPFCGRHATSTYHALDSAYIRTGKVRYVLRDLPLGFHAMARPAAIAARCVARQSPDAFWDYHDAVFASQAELADSTLRRIAQGLKLDEAAFDACRRSESAEEAVDADIAEAGRLGLTGTPSFVVGRGGPEDSVRGEVIRGAFPYERFATAIEAVLGAEQVAVQR